MAKTGGTGVIHFEMDSFYTTDNSGHFDTTGKATCIGCAKGDGTISGGYATPDGGVTLVSGNDDCEDAPVVGEVSFDAIPWVVLQPMLAWCILHSYRLEVVEDAELSITRATKIRPAKIEFTEVTLADGEALGSRWTINSFRNPPVPAFHLTFSGLVPTTIRIQRIMGMMRAIWQTSVTGRPTRLQVPLNPVIMPSAKKLIYNDFDLGPHWTTFLPPTTAHQL